MADHSAVVRVAKLLAHAVSGNPAEAEQGVNGAFARMKRDGVEFEDLLDLPDELLYQTALVRLAEHISNQRSDLSLQGRRELYAQYLRKIVARFSQTEGPRSADEKPSGGQGGDGRSREEHAREYEARSRREEAHRREERDRKDHGSGSPGTDQDSTYSRQNAKTAGRNNSPAWWLLDQSTFPLRFPGRETASLIFGRRSFLGCVVSYPVLTAQLFVNACFFAFLIFVGLVVALSFFPSRLDMETLFGVVYHRYFRSPISTILQIALIISYIRYENGWYPIGSLSSQEKLVAVIRSLSFFFVGLIVRGINFSWRGILAVRSLLPGK